MPVKCVFLIQMPLMNRVTTHSRATGILFTCLCMNILPTSHFLTNLLLQVFTRVH